ncbi:MAG TPA: ABC transporter permease [Rhizobiales bacterium]|nr:ABC transporter permease [Hyphomicrobiales bacterium]
MTVAGETGGALRRALLLAPAYSVLAGLFLVPMALLFAVSFWTVRSFRLRPDFTTAAYERVFGDYAGVLATTLSIGVATALLCTFLGFVFAYGVRFRAGRFGDALIVMALITLFGGYLVKIYAWKAILSQDGLVNSLLLGAGIASAPVGWLIYNPGAVVVALVHFLLPFAILPIYAELRNVRDITIEAARDLGATPAQTLFRVVLPQCRLGLFSAFAIAFLSAAGDYVTPMFLGGGSGMMLGQFVAQEFSTRFNWPAGAAMSFTLMGACLLVLAAAAMLVLRGRR